MGNWNQGKQNLSKGEGGLLYWEGLNHPRDVISNSQLSETTEQMTSFLQQKFEWQKKEKKWIEI